MSYLPDNIYLSFNHISSDPPIMWC